MKVVWLVAAFFLIFMFANELYRKTKHYYNNFLFEKVFFHIDDLKKLSNIVTGTSNALAAVSAFQQTGEYLVLARRYQSLKTDAFLLEQCAKKVKNATNVLIFVSPCVLLFDEEVNKNLERNLKSFFSGIVNPSIRTRLNSRFPVMFNIKLVKYILFDEKERTGFYFSKTETISAEQSEHKAKLLCDTWKKQFHIENFTIAEIKKNRQTVIDENIHVLKTMIQFCKENGLNPIIVSSPFSQKLCEILGGEFMEFFDELIYGLCKKANIFYFDYIKDEDFAQSYTLFSDGCFVLNKQGSYIFMRKFIKQIGGYNDGIN